MDVGILIALAVVAFGAGVWFYRITSHLHSIDDKLAPLILLHKKELIEYYLEKGVSPNPSLTPRKKYLIERLEDSTIGHQESQELVQLLKEDERKAKAAGNTDALVAVLGLVALVLIIASLSKQ